VSAPSEEVPAGTAPRIKTAPENTRPEKISREQTPANGAAPDPLPPSADAADLAGDDGEDQSYFLAVEEIFVGLRGSPLLLSPADWRVAQRWHRQGVPLGVVRRAMEEAFAKRAERGAKGKISSLRYLGTAVDAAWEALRDLAAAGEREEGEPQVDLAARLRNLAAALPAALPGRDELAARIAGLAARNDGDSESVEAALSALDAEMLETAENGLGEEVRAEIAEAVERTVGNLATRLDASEVARARTRLERQVLRQRLSLPVLSLFSPEARTGASAP
jgi:hypothetical protein